MSRKNRELANNSSVLVSLICRYEGDCQILLLYSFLFVNFDIHSAKRVSGNKTNVYYISNFIVLPSK